MSTRYPAAARSSSDSPPQNPYSRCSRAQSRHGSRTRQSRQIDRARPSRSTRVSGRSPAGAKNRLVWPTHAASVVQARGPVKIRFDTVSIATVVLRGLVLPFEVQSRGADRGDAGSARRPASPMVAEPGLSVQPSDLIDTIDFSDDRVSGWN